MVRINKLEKLINKILEYKQSEINYEIGSR